VNAENKKVAIIGLGLMGASLAMALKKNSDYEVFGWTRKKEVRDSLREKGILDKTADDLENIIRQAEITVLCLPVPMIIEYCRKYAECWKPGSIVTDVGSVKKTIIDSVHDILAERGVEFVGAHPMAGTEKSGPDAAFDSLYNNATVFITPTDDTSTEAEKQVEQLWKSVNANVFEINIDEHDKVMAETSHLSHIVSYCLVLSVLSGDEKTAKKNRQACSSGFRDVTRITSSSPRMWREIIEANRPAVSKAMKNFRTVWTLLEKAVESGDVAQLQKIFVQAKNLRDEWLNLRFFPEKTVFRSMKNNTYENL
jgi:prephenate dehydrogenase